MLRHLFPLLRLSLGFVGLTVTIVFFAAALGIVPDRARAVLDGRKALAESAAIYCSAAAQHGDIDSARDALEEIGNRARRAGDLVSLGLRQHDGKLLVSVGDHDKHWQDEQSNPELFATGTQMAPAISMQDKDWGRVELRFEPIRTSGFLSFLSDPVLRLAAFIGVAGLLAYYVYCWRLFRKIFAAEQSGAVPRRVRNTMDTLAEGVLIVDKEQRIVLANEAFANAVGTSAEELRGKSADELPWVRPETSAETHDGLPWDGAVTNQAVTKGTVLGLKSDSVRPKTFSVNSMPILNNDGECRGALATFDNLTLIEKKNSHLRKLMAGLKQSREEIRKQNKQLKAWAIRDPLTACLNRRAFFDLFETQWQAALRYSYPLSCIMADVDHFKSINDRYGHSTGDKVLKHIAEILRTQTRQGSHVCRFGGEEFCVLLPNLDIDQARSIAERLRRAIASRKCSDITVTASFGVSAMSLGAVELHGLLDEADQALYAAKRGGRNRVVSKEDLHGDGNMSKDGRDERDADALPPIPFPAVTALVASLGNLFPEVAEHSMRMADLCVAAGFGLLSQKACFIVEVGALLHDIGKIAVPEEILRKAGPLSEDEWQIMRGRQRVTEEIVNAAFSSPELRELIRCHTFWYHGNENDVDQPRGDAIPLGARLLCIADAYDAMVTRHPYRSALKREEAFAELHRCAGKQFDPDLVERFIQAVLARDESRPAPMPLALPTQTALTIGGQMERLAGALDAQDFRSLVAMAGRLRATAQTSNIEPLTELSAKIEERSAATEADKPELTRLTLDLLQMCRSSYQSCIPANDH